MPIRRVNLTRRRPSVKVPPSERCYTKPEDPPGKRALLEAGLRLFVREGLAETTVRDIGRAGGYTNPAIFKHFATKDDLAFHLFVRCFDYLRRVLLTSSKPSGPYRQRARAMLRCSLLLMDEDLDAVLYAVDNVRRFWSRMPPSARQNSLLDQWSDLFRAGIREGAVARDLDPRLLAAAVLGLLSQIAKMFYFHEFSGSAVDRLGQIERIVIRMGRK
jgi:AcrR family transcriptional regulator